MNVLVLGASGYTGSKIREVLSEYYNVYGTYFTQGEIFKNDEKMFYLNIDSIESIKKLLKKTEPMVIISAIRGSFNKLIELHEYICNYLKKVENGKLILLSSANVFDMELSSVHYENDKRTSMTEYGGYKIECEEIGTRILGDKCVILRLPEILGKNCPRIKDLRENIANNKIIKTWSNLYVNKATDEQIAQYIKFILENDKTGIFHVGSSDICDYTEFQKRVAEKLHLGIPKFKEKIIPQKVYQAVLTSRSDVPDYLKLTIDEIIQQLYLEDKS